MASRSPLPSEGMVHAPLIRSERHWRAGMVLVAGAAMAATPWLLELGPANVCIFKALSGLPCPLCGGTHACAALLVGNWRAAWQANAGVLPLLWLVWGVMLQWLYEALAGRRLWWAGRWTAAVSKMAWQAVGAFLLAAWLWRLFWGPLL